MKSRTGLLSSKWGSSERKLLKGVMGRNLMNSFVTDLLLRVLDVTDVEDKIRGEAVNE